VTLPARVVADVSRALADIQERGLGTRIVRESPLGGGCIHRGTRIETDSGATLFLKWNDYSKGEVPAGMFEAEADGLAAIGATKTLRAPEALAWGGEAGGTPWLLVEYVLTERAVADTGERLGRGLAALHASGTDVTYGWRRDNWIGSLPQTNTSAPSWGDFWRDRRIAPQLERARRAGYLRDAGLDRVLELTPQALADVARPELVHGDLWGGNWLVGRGGEPVLIDPAVYAGHGEVDLAMSELFGGFDRSFYDAYEHAHGISRAYTAYRRDLYQLYYLMVHVNLFGASYVAGVTSAAERVIAEFGA
jgi:fructosamine-3-kinase